jgi:hypothetical protein
MNSLPESLVVLKLLISLLYKLVFQASKIINREREVQISKYKGIGTNSVIIMECQGLI